MPTAGSHVKVAGNSRRHGPIGCLRAIGAVVVFCTTVPTVEVAGGAVMSLVSGGRWLAGPIFITSLASLGVAVLSTRLYWTRSRWSWAWGLAMPVATALICVLVAVVNGLAVMYACGTHHTANVCPPGHP